MSTLSTRLVALSDRRQRGTFVRAPSQPSTGAWQPEGDDWLELLVDVYSAHGGHAYRFDGASLRRTPESSVGVEPAERIGYANDWLAPNVESRGAVAAGELRPTLSTVAGVVSAVFTGDHDTPDNQRLHIPHFAPQQGTIVMVARLLSTTQSNQTLLQTSPARLMASFAGFTGPTVRTGGTQPHQYAFGLATMHERWTALVAQFNRGTNMLRFWADSLPTWTETVAQAWFDDTDSMICRNSFAGTNGGPANAAVRALALINSASLTPAQVQKAVDWAIAGTGISATVPNYTVDPGPGEPAGDHWRVNMYDLAEYMPASPRTVAVANQTQFTNALAGFQAGDVLVLQPGNYNGFTLQNRNFNANNRGIIRAADLNNKPTITGTINIYNSSYIILHGLRTNGLSPAIRGGRTQDGEFQHNVHIARCELRQCGLQAITFDRRSRRYQIRNNLITTNTQTSTASAGQTTLIHMDIRAGTNIGDPAYWVSEARIEHNIFDSEGALNSISGARQGHIIYMSTDRYQGNAHQNASIAYNFFRSPRKHPMEIKTGGIKFTGNRLVRMDDAAGGNTTFTIRQASSDAAPGQGANEFRGNVYDGLDAVNILDHGNGIGHYANGERYLGGTTLRLFSRATGGAHGQPPADNMRLDHCQGGTCVVGYKFSDQTHIANVVGVQLHNCAFSAVQLVNQTGTQQTGLTQLEPAFQTHVLQRNEVGPGAFSTAPGEPQEPGPGPVDPVAIFRNPFNKLSAHHIPIGTGMNYLGTGHSTYTQGLNKGNTLLFNVGNPFGHSIVIARNTDPIVTVHWNNAQTGLNLPAQLRIPASFKPERVPKPTGGYRDSACTIYNADTDQAYMFYNFAWVNGRYEAAILRPLISFKGLGHGTVDGERLGTSATGVAGAFGVLRGWELSTPGQAITHCLQAVLPADPNTSMMLGKLGLNGLPRILPATSQDNAATTNSNYALGPIPYGALIALPPPEKGGPTKASLNLTEVGGRLYDCLVRYGIRAVDKGGDVNGAIRADQDFPESLRNNLNTDMGKMYKHLRVCNFDQSQWAPNKTTPFGGGTPLGPNTALL